MSPEERLEILEAAAHDFCSVSVPLPCKEAWNGTVTLRVVCVVGYFRFSRDLGVTGGEKDITRERALEYIARTVTDPLAD